MNKRKFIGIVCLVVLAAIVTGLVYLSLSDRQQYKLLPTTPKEGASLYQPVQWYCSAGGAVVVCRDLKSGQTTKYRLPDALSEPLAIVPSPDGSKFIVQTAPDPLYVENSGLIYITDQKFTVLRTIPADNKVSYSSVSWADKNNLVAVARRTTASGKTKLSLYNSATQQERIIGQESDTGLIAYPSADGQFALVEERTADKPSLRAVSLASGDSKVIRTDSLLDHMQSYATVGYDNTSNTFYISGSGKQIDKPVLVIAQVAPGAKELEFAIRQVISDGSAYAPLLATSQGMLASRQADGPSHYGFLQANGNFKKAAIAPPLPVTFGSSQRLGLDPVTSGNSLTPDDYYFQRRQVSAPANLAGQLKQLVTDPGCPRDSIERFNRVGLLATDANQAVASFIACGRSSNELRYYGKAGDTYSLLGISRGTPTCDTKASLQLSDTVAPSCIAH